MQYKVILLALLADQLSMTAAAPSGTRTLHKRSFRVDRVAVGAATPKNVVQEVQKAFNKFSMTMPSGLANANLEAWAGAPRVACADGSMSGQGSAGNVASTAASSITVPLSTANPAPSAQASGGLQVGNVTNNPVGNDVEFAAQITVGGQQMQMDFDTGSSDLWVFSTSLPAQDQQGHQVFDPTKSSTFKLEPGASWNISFGDGSSASGNVVGTDNVDIGGATATGQVVELATSVAASFVQQTASNGLVGLAFGNINTVTPKKATTFLETIANDLEQPIMAADLRHGAPGSYEFGTTDSTLFQAPLQFTAVDPSNGFWQFASNSFSVGTGGQVTQNPGAAPAIADTGTTLMLVDSNVAAAYYEQVPNAAEDQETGTFVFPCDSQLPDLNVAAGPSMMLTIPGSVINFGPVQGGGTAKAKRGGKVGFYPHHKLVRKGTKQNAATNSVGSLEAAAAFNGQLCSGGVQSNQGANKQIFGDVMFKAQYTVFNVGNNSIGFAPHAL